MVGDRHADGVDVPAFLLEQLAPVLVDADLRKPPLQRFDAAQVHVGDRDQVERRVPAELVQVVVGLAAGADARVTEHPSLRSDGDREQRRRRGRDREGLQETPAGERTVWHGKEPIAPGSVMQRDRPISPDL